jgi:hypothetical protein
MESPLYKIVLPVRTIELQKEQVDQRPRKEGMIIIGRLEAFRMKSKVKVLTAKQGQEKSYKYGNCIPRHCDANNPVRGR